VVPPGVDADRFAPLDDGARRAARAAHGLDPDATVVLGLSRLVPRKGMDVLIQAAARLSADRPDLTVAISGGGRDEGRLRKLAGELSAPVRFLGRVPDEDLPDLYACGDVFAMLCRNRWRGLEQEGFGIVFLEAAAAGVPAVAGESGGAAEAVATGETGLVVDPPTSVEATAAALADLLDDEERRRSMGEAARRRAEKEFAYEVLAARLAEALET
jgi:phosphatidylinositol alpha-1,6-mannosyltransferase